VLTGGRFDGFPRDPSLGLQGPAWCGFEQQQVLGQLARRRSAGRDSGLMPIAIVIRQDGAIVGEHARRFGRGETIYDPWHYVPVLARKPGALRNGAPFKDLAVAGQPGAYSAQAEGL